MVDNFGVKSVIDVGCGRGISTKWFLDRKLDVLCVEGEFNINCELTVLRRLF